MMQLKKNRKIRNILLLTIITIIAGTAIVIGVMMTINKTIYPDIHEDILWSYHATIDIPNMLNGEFVVEQVNTPYSILYHDRNQRHMYVFSLPVRDQNESTFTPSGLNFNMTTAGYEVIQDDRTIVISNTSVILKNGEDAVELLMDSNDMQTEKIEKYTDCYGRTVDAFRYQTEKNELIVSATYGGVLFEMTISEPCSQISFPLSIKGYDIAVEDAGYSLLSKDEVNRFLFHAPMVYDNGESERKYGTAKIKGLINHEIQYGIPSGTTFPAKLVFTVDCYSDSMFFDGIVNSERPFLNSIYASSNRLEKNEMGKESYIYTKFNIRSFTPKKEKLLQRLLYSFYVMNCSEEVTFEVYSIRNDWCGLQLNWTNKPKNYEKIGEFTLHDPGWYSIDLTTYAGQLIREEYYDLENNSIMIRVKKGYEGYADIASCDNSVAPPYFEVFYSTK